MVIQLSNGGASAHSAAGDPHYGQALSPAAIQGVTPEGTVEIRYQEESGRYPDGEQWNRRRPSYHVGRVSHGPLDASTVLKPRLAPAIFGAGLLEAISEGDIIANAEQQRSIEDGVWGIVSWIESNTTPVIGRFGWQATQWSIRSQTAAALAHDMGLTSAEMPRDDCAPVQTACLASPHGGRPEVSREFMDALETFQRHLPVPRTPVDDSSAAAEMFRRIGCATCHRESYQIRSRLEDDVDSRTIQPYTDLLLHDLGDGLADRTVDGRTIPSRWRTAPLWGLGYKARGSGKGAFALLHDGRARSIEEAILWHDGEARAARIAFERLPAERRRTMFRWIEAR